MGDKGDNIIILLAVEPMSDAKKIKKESTALGKEMAKGISEKFPDINFTIGIGRYYSKMEELFRSYEAVSYTHLGPKRVDPKTP